MNTIRLFFKGLCVILACFVVGNLTVYTLALPFPPALIGLACLLLILSRVRYASRSVVVAAQPLLKHMSVLFVPAVLGVGVYWAEIRALGPALFLSIGVSTVVSLGVAAIFAQKLLHRNTK